jgi:hypothetical protein
LIVGYSEKRAKKDAYNRQKGVTRLEKTYQIIMSVDKVLDIAKTITTIRLRLPKSNTTKERTMLITDRHKSIARLFDENFWQDSYEQDGKRIIYMTAYEFLQITYTFDNLYDFNFRLGAAQKLSTNYTNLHEFFFFSC